MMNKSQLSRRDFIQRSGTAGMGLVAGVALFPDWLSAAQSPSDSSDLIRRISDPQVRYGIEAAIAKNLVPAASQRPYPGHFNITADGGAYGGDATWPGLDSWQMAGAYLLLGRTRMVLDYFDFVRASQRKDGNIPFAVFTENTRPDGGCLRGLKYPDDTFTYSPPKREDLPATSQQTSTWIGLFEHWQTLGYPLSVLGPLCYILTAGEIFEATASVAWLKERLDSLDAAAKYVLSRKTPDGLIGGSGFYTEAPPRNGCDGVTQCYAVHSFRQMAKLCAAAGCKAEEAAWSGDADKLSGSFSEAFWRHDHFGEYVHPQRGLVDSHGLSDVNWAAVAFGVADDQQVGKLWPLLMKEPSFWHGDMPTQTVTKPFSYESWEINESAPCPAPPLNDVAAMGRAWYLEATACRRMREQERLAESVRKVCRAAQPEGFWRERYHPKPDGSVSPGGAQKYCEYPAILVRVVFANQHIFCS